jgi:hypothetical protein
LRERGGCKVISGLSSTSANLGSKSSDIVAWMVSEGVALENGGGEIEEEKF